MADTSNNLPQLSPSENNKELRINELFAAMSPASEYAIDEETTDGLTWGYLRNRWGGFSGINGTLTLTASNTNYFVVSRADGSPSVSTSAANWNNTAAYARAYKIVVGTEAPTDWEDHRSGPRGILGADWGTGIITESGTSRDMTADDAERYIRFTNASAKTFTIQPDSTEPLLGGSEYHGRNVGAGSLELVEGSGVTINIPFGGSLEIPQGGTFTLKRVATDEFDLMGQTVAA